MIANGAEGRGRTGTSLSAHWILSPARLPIPPLRHGRNDTIYYPDYQEIINLADAPQTVVG